MHQDGSGKITPAEYLNAARAHLRTGKARDAYQVLLHASLDYSDDPVILSYFGCLEAVVDKKYTRGIETCKRAIAILKARGSTDEGLLMPIFYLNLGRACVAGRKKQEAVDAFTKGLSYNKGSIELQKELRALGKRKKPPVPFLSRSNPINKYIGLLLHKK